MLFLLFQLGKDRYALEAAQVVEVVPVVHLKKLPQACQGVAGVFNYRGTPVPVLDLSEIACHRPSPTRLSTRMILVHYALPNGEKRILGLMAERATETMNLDKSAFVAPGVDTPDAPYLGPVANDSRGLIQWIEVNQLLPGTMKELLFQQAQEIA
jgi:chemotaxis-related protein WspB